METLTDLQNELAEINAALTAARQIQSGGHSDATYRLPDLKDLYDQKRDVLNKIARLERGGIGLVR